MIVTLPVDIPVTAPELVTRALVVSLLLHVPPVALFERVVVPPTHRLNIPVITPGAGFTVNVVVAMHPSAAI